MIDLIINLLQIVGFIAILPWIAMPFLSNKEKGDEILPELSEKPRLFRAGMDSSEGEAFLTFRFQCRLPHYDYCI